MTEKSKNYIEVENMNWEEVAPKMKRQVLGYDKNIMMVKVHFEKGGVGAKHNHPHTQTTYIASGKFEVTIGDESKNLKEGDGFFAKSNVEHGVVCLEEGILIDVFNPMREDFI